jgi:hypothetical protein
MLWSLAGAAGVHQRIGARLSYAPGLQTIAYFVAAIVWIASGRAAANGRSAERAPAR